MSAMLELDGHAGEHFADVMEARLRAHRLVEDGTARSARIIILNDLGKEICTIPYHKIEERRPHAPL